MSVDLRKRIIDLSKKAAFAANKHGIEGQRAQVVLVLDLSASMNAFYKSGVIQRVIERILGLAVTFDDPGRGKPRRSGRGRIARTAKPSLVFSGVSAAARCTGARWRSAPRRSLLRSRTATRVRPSSSVFRCRAAPGAASGWRRP